MKISTCLILHHSDIIPIYSIFAFAALKLLNKHTHTHYKIQYLLPFFFCLDDDLKKYDPSGPTKII